MNTCEENQFSEQFFTTTGEDERNRFTGEFAYDPYSEIPEAPLIKPGVYRVINGIAYRIEEGIPPKLIART